MPASTGTDGRGGRLRAVQATASASTSRATRNFISPPPSAQPALVDGVVPSPRAGPPVLSAVLIVPGAVLPGETPASGCSLRGPFGASAGPLRTGIPTQTGVRENLEISPSSSSSLVWKLGRTLLRAGQRPDRHVGPLWAVSVVLLSTRGHLDGRAHAGPVVHVLSPVHPPGRPQPVRRLRARLSCDLAFCETAGQRLEL